jgi:hypothetical protein
VILYLTKCSRGYHNSLWRDRPGDLLYAEVVSSEKQSPAVPSGTIATTNTGGITTVDTRVLLEQTSVQDVIRTLSKTSRK